MIGIVDVGGGMRGIYSAGVYDYLIERNIDFDYCLGVSAGSANLMSYVAKQKGRNYPFYYEYAFRKEYMSFHNWLIKGSFFDFDYIYSDLSNEGGENPVDYDSFKESKSEYVVVATEANTGKARYFDKSDVSRNNYDILKASCCVPTVCKPYIVKGVPYYDGGIAEPVPFKKAFKDGCDRVVVVLTRPRDYIKGKQSHMSLIKHSLRKYPETFKKIEQRNEKYNEAVEELKKMEKTGEVLIVDPKECFGITTLKKEKIASKKLYELGYSDGEKVEKYLKNFEK
ncbi:MAG: hypothetical protein PWP28_1115 [Oceanotoga sp.]|uniref:patatin-like phospholipase family protein n=1 Tax=Oceanotoga sp. TaxID=2108366 RepID=UPI00264F0520|nr:patatin family protein [Oceanotoga sp.]MDN5342240.1 hypothetical protein [Oceanotoga sp.]